MKTDNLSKKISSILISTWIVLAFLSVFYNGVKISSEIKEWGSLSDFQKRQKIFGDKYDFIIFIQNHTKEQEQIIIFSQDPMTFYLSRYYLYPMLVYWAKDKNDLQRLIETHKFSYIASYRDKIKINGFELAASSSADARDAYGYIYEKK